MYKTPIAKFQRIIAHILLVSQLLTSCMTSNEMPIFHKVEQKTPLASRPLQKVLIPIDVVAEKTAETTTSLPESEKYLTTPVHKQGTIHLPFWQKVALCGMLLHNTFSEAYRPRTITQESNIQTHNASGIEEISRAKMREFIKGARSKQYAFEVTSEAEIINKNYENAVYYKMLAKNEIKDSVYENFTRRLILEKGFLYKNHMPPIYSVPIFGTLITIMCQYDFDKANTKATEATAARATAVKNLKFDTLGRGHDVFVMRCSARNDGDEEDIEIKMFQKIKDLKYQTTYGYGMPYYTVESSIDFLDSDVNNPGKTYTLERADRKSGASFTIPNTSGTEVELFTLSDTPNVGCIDAWGGRDVANAIGVHIYDTCKANIPPGVNYKAEEEMQKLHTETSSTTSGKIIFEDILVYKKKGNIDYSVATESYQWKATPECKWDHKTQTENPVFDPVDVNHNARVVPQTLSYADLENLPVLNLEKDLECISLTIRESASNEVNSVNSISRTPALPGHQELIELSEHLDD
jgi:hypothetical protein